MSDNRQQRPPSKPQNPPAISSSELHDLRKRVESLETFIKELFDERNQWNSVLRSWVGKKIYVRFTDGSVQTEMILRWIDRYTLGVDDCDGDPLIIHKAAIATIGRDDD